jgi:death-on-curing protein
MIRIFPSVDAVIAINAVVTGMDEAIVQQSAKLGLLDSALNAPLAGFGDVDIYPLDAQRLGVLCSRIVLNHPFIDGNKRTGFLVMIETAYLNGLTLEFSDQDEVSDWIEALAAGQLAEDVFCDHIGAVLNAM